MALPDRVKPACAQRFAAVALLAATVAVAGAATAADCKLARIAEWPLRVAHNQLVVAGAIDGHPVGAMLDTGAPATMIWRAAAARLGLATSWVSGMRMSGVGGETDVERVWVRELMLGEASRKDLWMLVAGDLELRDGIDVLLGEDFLHAVDLEFDLAHNAVRLFVAKDCEGKSLAYWAPREASTAALEPIDERYPRAVVSVKIDGHPLRALVDSGAAVSLLDRRFAAQLGVEPGGPGVKPSGRISGIGKKSVEVWLGPFDSVAIGDELISHTSLRFADLSEMMQAPGAPRMLLGVDFLRSHRVLLAPSQRLMYFTHNGGPVFQPGPAQ